MFIPLQPLHHPSSVPKLLRAFAFGLHASSYVKIPFIHFICFPKQRESDPCCPVNTQSDASGPVVLWITMLIHGEGTQAAVRLHCCKERPFGGRQGFFWDICPAAESLSGVHMYYTYSDQVGGPVAPLHCHQQRQESYVLANTRHYPAVYLPVKRWEVLSCFNGIFL